MLEIIKRGSLVLLALSFTVGLTGVTSVGATSKKDPKPQEKKVLICHSDNNVKKPYGPKAISVNVSAVDGVGKSDHFGEHKGPLATSVAVAQSLKDKKIKWGDIIPPVKDVHNGLNWTKEGRAIYYNDCQFPEVEKDYYFNFQKKWRGDKINLEDVDVTFYIGDTSWQIGDDPVEVKPGQKLSPLSEKVTGLPENCTYKSNLPDAFRIPKDPKELTTLKVKNYVKCKDMPAPEFELQFEKVWDGDEVDLEGVEVVFVNSEGQEAEPGDVVSGDDIYPGATVDGLTEVVTGFPEDCTFTNDIQESYVLFEDLVSAELRAVVTDVPTNGEMSYTDTITVTNTVECDEPTTPVVPEGETEVPPTTTTPVSTTTTTPQVTATPVGAVDAGAGSALTALAGLFGSTGLFGLGVFFRKFNF